MQSSCFAHDLLEPFDCKCISMILQCFPFVFFSSFCIDSQCFPTISKLFFEIQWISRFVKQYLRTSWFCNSPLMMSNIFMMLNDSSICLNDLSMVFKGFAVLGIFDEANTILFLGNVFFFFRCRSAFVPPPSKFMKIEGFLRFGK